MKVVTSGWPIVSLSLSALLFALWSLAAAQESSKLPRIGYLASASAADTLFRTEPFRKGLSERGYIEGKNIFIEYRYANGKVEHIRALASELVDLNVALIVSAGPVNTRAAKKATNTIPIVITQDPDPVANGFVASLAHPGGNITGLSTVTPELSGKRLELLKEFQRFPVSLCLRNSDIAAIPKL